MRKKGWKKSIHVLVSVLMLLSVIMIFPNYSGSADSSQWKYWDAQVGVEKDKEWTIKFNIPLNPSTVNDTTIFVTELDGKEIQTDVSLNQNLVTVKPMQSYTSGQSYYLYVTSGVQSTNGKFVATPVRMEFTIADEIEVDTGEWVGPLEVTPDFISVNKDVEVRANILVDHSPAELAPVEDGQSPVQLFKSYNGTNWTLANEMFDNGQLDDYADEISGDRVYSTKLLLNESAEGVLYLRATVTTKGGNEFSRDTEIDIYQSNEGADVQEVIENHEEVSTSIETIFEENPASSAEEVLAQASEALVASEDIKNVEVEGNILKMEFDNGLTSFIQVQEETEDGESTRGPERSSKESIPLTQQTRGNDSEGQSFMRTFNTLSVESIGSRNVLLWAPFENEFAPYNESNELLNILNQSSVGFDVEVLKNEQADVASLKHMTDYGLIVLATHGYDGKWIGTGEIVVDQAKYEVEQKKGEMSIWQNMKLMKNGTVEKWAPTYALSSDWFNNQLQGTFSNTIIVNNSCESTKNDDLWNVFRNKGAGAYFGYSQNVTSRFAVEQVVELVGNIALDMQNVGNAYIEKADPYNWGGANAIWQMRGKTDLQFAEGLINGSFENGLLGWQTYGDGRVITGLGYEFDTAPRHGNKEGIISTGLGYSEAEGAIQQTFYLDPQATTLTFEWNYLSEEFLEYINTGYDDPFKVTISTADGKSVDILDLSVSKIAEKYGASNPNDYGWDYYSGGAGSDYDSDEELNGDYYPEEDWDNDYPPEDDWEFGYPHEQYGGDLTYVSPDIVFDIGDVWMTGWVSESFTIPTEFKGKTVTIQFYAVDAGDTIYDTAVLIDNVRVEY